MAKFERSTRRLELSSGRSVSRRDVLRWGFVSGAGVAIGAPLLAGCQSGTGEVGPGPAGRPPSEPTGVLRVPSNGELTTLDPTLSFTPVDLAFGANIFESLVRFKRDSLELEGELAESFESSPDAREWTFRLKEGVRFHDSEPLTSAAVKASFLYYADGGFQWATLLPSKLTYDDTDPNVIRIISETPSPDIGRNAALLKVISPRVLAAGKGAVNNSPIGTGPFKFVSQTPAEKVILEANNDYRGPGPYLERIEIPIIPDPTARIAALRSGSVDLVTSIAPTDAAQLRTDPGFVVSEQVVGNMACLFLSVEIPPTDKLEIRQAISYAIDRQAIIDSIFGGEGAEVLDSVLTPADYGYVSPKAQYPLDLDRAEQLVRESGLTVPIRVDARWITGIGQSLRHDRVLQAISTMVQKVGIDLSVSQASLQEVGNAFGPNSGRAWPVLMAGMVHGYTSGPWNWSNRFFDHVSGLHSVSEFQELATEMLTTPDGPERLQILAKMQEFFAGQLPVIPLYTMVAIDARQRLVKGYETPRDGVQAYYGEVYMET